MPTKNMMQKKYLPIFGLIVATCFSSCGNAPQNTNTPAEPQVEYGVNIFRKNCVSCHGAEGNMGFNGAFDLTKSSLSAAERVAVITYGRKAMTPFKQLLTEAEINAVADYTLSLKK